MYAADGAAVEFEELQAAIKTGRGTLATTRLLSITLDPVFDTPEVLKSYAGYHHADPQTWSFATGDEKEVESFTRAFSVYRQPIVNVTSGGGEAGFFVIKRQAAKSRNYGGGTRGSLTK